MITSTKPALLVRIIATPKENPTPEPQPTDPIFYRLIAGTIILLIAILAILLWKK